MNNLNAENIFRIWTDLFNLNPGNWSKFSGKYLWKISDKGKLVTCLTSCNLNSEALMPYSGKADCEISCDINDFTAILFGTLNPQVAFLEKRLTIKGKIKHILRFNFLLDRLIRESKSVLFRENNNYII